MRRLILLSAIVAFAVACAGDDPQATTTSALPDPGPDRYAVVMESFAFTPAELTVPVGATVVWTNRHAANHDVVATDGLFRSPLFGTGETYSFTFTEPGEYPYFCSIHPSMQGKIIVVGP
jgi:plastocyanin